MAQHNLFGTQAEEKALEYLLQRGYQLLEKNYRYAHAEVDLLMRKKDKLICVEVKALVLHISVAQKALSPQKKYSYWFV